MYVPVFKLRDGRLGFINTSALDSAQEYNINRNFMDKHALEASQAANPHLEDGTVCRRVRPTTLPV